ncbi:MAG: 3D-(3,5/4)-trihydroxycyclohexane-1,2-dione acylhydrolase (decyclizing) [Candidatus Competibacteraceae bacterium]|nr:3D-(3,5/4)-trihydroxycyclohexane-1,2-dione acylhydrolase (decyclizing) [Candidatus Competibacteraceae bacterium]MCB1804179.1 3D-(3,5/4)-trihydroxycyclohexane-1,2-dione acylhydrolase (decyclizing) [Candidatus Competibacteraceae bacterium]MCB1810287.1 3D-(3,5/4)-trihydroxycyclohexane-1,2-dione acylhydrolase (decyclizing) [Candidatus Competibacteraceae bacterium]
MNTQRLTAAQALVKYLCAQYTVIDGQEQPLFAGIFAIFGHGNVAAMGEALYQAREALPTYRAHNEQAMALTAIAYAKAHNRQRMMACTTSIGPGATNMVTAAALAHVNRLPVLLLPGDIFASRRPDPVLQQIENFGDPTLSANDCFRPASRFFDRITRPEQLITSLPVALQTLTDPLNCGPVTLALPQDVQAMAYDYPSALFERKVHRLRRPEPDQQELLEALTRLRQARKPIIIAGGGVHYSLAAETLAGFAEKHAIPVAETQAGKGALPWDHPCQLGSIGVTGSSAANRLATQADVILAIGTRLQDFATGSRTLFPPSATLIQLNIAPFDAIKHNAVPLIGDARRSLELIDMELGDWCADAAWTDQAHSAIREWNDAVEKATARSNAELPSDAHVIGAVNRAAGPRDVVVCAAGGLPGELHKLWRCQDSKSYHLEYGYSCMGYEIAGGLGVKLADPSREIFVMVGDGSYLMMNSEIASSITLGQKLIIVVLDNRGYGCINRLQNATGGASFNNLFEQGVVGTMPKIDFAAHAASLGANSEQVRGIGELEAALERAKASEQTYVIALDTDPVHTTQAGGCWWDVAVPEVSKRAEVQHARASYERQQQNQPF